MTLLPKSKTTSSQTTLTKILNLSEPLSSEEQQQLLKQLQLASEKIGNEIQNPRHRG